MDTNEHRLEKAKEAISEEDAKDMGEKFLKGNFNLIDLYQQMSSLKKMGSLKKLMEMLPGMSQLKMPKEMLDVQDVERAARLLAAFIAELELDFLDKLAWEQERV